MVVALSRRTKIPGSVILLDVIVLALCVVDAITRGSWWPLGTMVIVVTIMFLVNVQRREYDIAEMRRADRERRARLHEFLVREDVERQMRKGRT